MIEVIIHWDHCMLNHFQDVAFPNKYHTKVWIPSALVLVINNSLEVLVRAPQAQQGRAWHHTAPQPGAGRHRAAPDSGHLPGHYTGQGHAGLWDHGWAWLRRAHGSWWPLWAGMGSCILSREPWQVLPPWAGGSWGGWQCFMAWTALFSLSDKEESMKPAELK